MSEPKDLDEKFVLPRAPLTRYDYGLLALCGVGIGALFIIIYALIVG